MKFAVDLDGTAWKYRKLFAHLMLALKQAGHQVGILTAHAPELQREDMRLLAARRFPYPDFFLNRCSDEPLAGREWKIAMVKEHGIDCLFDDFDQPDKIELYCLHEDESNE